jgi:hypothetical protein
MNTDVDQRTHVEEPAQAITPEAATVAIVAQVLREMRRREGGFSATLSATTGQIPQQVVPPEADGVIRQLHNPTAAPITVQLYMAGNTTGNPLVNATLAAGAMTYCYFRFYNGLTCIQGSGAIVSGDIT